MSITDPVHEEKTKAYDFEIHVVNSETEAEEKMTPLNNIEVEKLPDDVDPGERPTL